MHPVWQNLLGSGIACVAALLLHIVLMRAVRLSTRREGLHRHRALFVGKVLKIALLFGLGLVLIGIWGFNMETIWIFVSGILGLVAIGFVAVWSLLSNIVAGVLLFFTNPFRIGEQVQLVGDETAGKVEDISLMFVVLRSESGLYRVPNNLFFQRAIRIGPPAQPEKKDPAPE